MSDAEDLLPAYDQQLRDEAETATALHVEPLGPLRLATFAGGSGFVTYRSLEEAGRPPTRESVAKLVDAATSRLVADPDIVEIEWKTRGHDHAPGLHDALLARGLEPGEPESVMVGEAELLAVDVAVVVEGLVVRRVHDEADVRSMCAMQSAVFDDSPRTAAQVLERVLQALRSGGDVELWVAEVDGEMVSAGRLEPVAGSEFAGVWGGATLPQWRGRGIYRALTAARARSALAHGKRYLHSDSTEFSRPILERSGLVKVTTTTPYGWSRS